MRLPLLGGCLCGSVRYQVDTPPRHTFYCHCRDCQKETGGPFAMEIYVAQEAVKMMGPQASFAVIGDSGKEVRRIRCAHCEYYCPGEIRKAQRFPSDLQARAR